ncbi:MAG TPA: radical SAM protein [Spirochaetota bacterium]|nr:radical SAM protein [Spirochaetota bacterium]HPC41777.1 radical SAM protein [Spirochaetota bacterium]HPL16553.1 radical SAM protein [Spirochaetota bacterium]HQF06624.1 radical SAM protein [Spirochaetota bacterium]HQH95973.1 radical SAM protein [Spirochaetota bacterium]
MAKQHITIPVFVPHLGCAHRCSFCDQWSTTPAAVMPGPELVDEMVRRYLPQGRNSASRIELAFFGGSFTGIRKDIQESYLARAHRHLEDRTIHGIRLSTRPDYISDESLVLLKKYGVTAIEIGVQSLDDAVLLKSNRGHDVRDVVHAVERVTRHGFDFVIQLMPGLPGETRASALRSAQIAAGMGPSAVRLYPAVVLKGTPLEEVFTAGDYVPLSLEDAVELCKDLYRIFLSRSIPVIRMGLHPLPPGRLASVVAGPYHPSFGFLVKARHRREMMTARIDRHLHGNGGKPAENLRLVLPDTNTGEYVGSGKENIDFIQKRFNLKGVRYSVGPVPDIQIMD